MQQVSLWSQIGGFFRQTWLVYVLAVIFGMSTVVLLATLRTPEYSAEVDLLVLQQYTINDAFTANKSAVAVRDTLADIIHTTSFYAQVQSSQDVDLTALDALPEDDRREEWEEVVETRSSGSSATITIVGYDQDPGQAVAIASSVAQTLVQFGREYHSSPDTISLRVVDDPIVSSYPTRPNLLTNGIAAAVFGAMLGALILFLRPSANFGYANKMKDARYNPHDSRGHDDYSDVVDVPPSTHPDESLPPPEYNVLDVNNYQTQQPVKEDLQFHPSHMNPHAGAQVPPKEFTPQQQQNDTPENKQ
jgi:capsular polysaccharide biosynthesis protein